MKTNPIIILTLMCFLGTGIIGPMPAYAQEIKLPAPGVMIHLSPEFNPPVLKGIKVHPDNPFRFDFILDKGDSDKKNEELKEESNKLIKYFLASLTIPEKDLWVNLSPYEKDRIIPQFFGLTEMGRDLLAEDYMLKQITASLIYPEDEIGKKFWKRIYEEAAKKYGSTNIPVNTFNKVWIVPEKALVYENAKAGTAYVVESKLKVMLEQDYLSLEKHDGIQSEQLQTKDNNQLGSQIVREIVIPELTKEINEGKNFVQLRQVYNSLILAIWYKKKIKDNILAQVYKDKNKIAGVNIDNPQEKQKIYEQYLQAFKKGVYNYIKEDFDTTTHQTMPRKYFSGGTTFNDATMSSALILVTDEAMIANNKSLKDKIKRIGGLIIISANLLFLGGDEMRESFNPSSSLKVKKETFNEGDFLFVKDAFRKGIDEGIECFYKFAMERFPPTYNSLRGSWVYYFLEDKIIQEQIKSYISTDGDKNKKIYQFILQSDGVLPKNIMDALYVRLQQGAQIDREEILQILSFQPQNKEQQIIFNKNLKTLIIDVLDEVNTKIKLPKNIYTSIKNKIISQAYFNKSIEVAANSDFTIASTPGSYAFKSTLAHEIGHNILFQYGYKSYSKDHKVLHEFFSEAVAQYMYGHEPALMGTKYHDWAQFQLYTMNSLAESRGITLEESGRIIYSTFLEKKDEGIDEIMREIFNRLGFKGELKIQRNNPEDIPFYMPKVTEKEPLNHAINVHKHNEGGIDLNPTNLNLQTQNIGGEIKFHLNPGMLQQLKNISGFVPVIIDIQPMTNIGEFLGVTLSK